MTDLHPDIPPPRTVTASAKPVGPTARLAGAAVIATAAVATLSLILVGPVPGAVALALAAHLVGASLAVVSLARHFPHPSLGLCNVVTLGRLALTAALFAPLLASASGWSVIAVALAALCLDGVDGWLARRERLTSDFGARFDMEVDALLGLVLAANAWAAGTVGPAVLLLGLPRYLFLAAASRLPWLSRPLPGSFARKTVCVLQIAALIALQVPGLPAPVAHALVFVTIAALAWSFGRDVLWLRRTRT